MTYLSAKRFMPSNFLNDKPHSHYLYAGCALLLYGFYLAGHFPVSDLCYYLRDTYSEPVYNKTIQVAGMLLVAAFAFAILLRLIHPVIQYLKLLVWSLFALTLAYYYQQLIVFAIEYIHFIQYIVFTIVVFCASKRRLLITIGVCLLAGLLDEMYQAQHQNSPLNWRDVLLNVIGVFWGCLLLWSVTETSPTATKQH